MTKLVQIDIVRFGYMFAFNVEQLIMLADTLFPLTEKLIIDELHYVVHLLKHEKRFSIEIQALDKKRKEILQKWKRFFCSFCRIQRRY